MRVIVQLLVFLNKRDEGKKYQSYCPEIRYFFGSGNSVEEVVTEVTATLLSYLAKRFLIGNFKHYGWVITEDSVERPTFTEEQTVKRAEELFGFPITDYQIVKIDVELPKVPKLR